MPRHGRSSLIAVIFIKKNKDKDKDLRLQQDKDLLKKLKKARDKKDDKFGAWTPPTQYGHPCNVAARAIRPLA